MYVVQQSGVAEQAFMLPQQTLGSGSSHQQLLASIAGVRTAALGQSQGQLPVLQQTLGRVQQAPVSGTTAQQHQQRVLLTGGTADSGKQLVYVNVNGTLQPGVVHNGAVYLLASSGSAAATLQAAASMHQPASGMQHVSGAGGQLVTLQQQPQPQLQQQPVVMQRVVYGNGALGPAVSGALVGARAGVQLQQQPQLQARPVLAVAKSMAPQQQHTPVYMHAALAPNTGVTVHAAAPRALAVPVGAGVSLQAPAQQVLMQQVPSAQTAIGAAGGRTVIVPGVAGSVSASTASLLPRMATSAGAATAQHGAARTVAAAGTRSQPMTIAAALAGLPSNATPTASGALAWAPAAGNGLPSPVAPPGTPGVRGAGAAAPSGTAARTIGAVISKLSGPESFGGAVAVVGSPAAGAVIVSAPQPAGEVAATPLGMSPLTSQPGTPSRSNSVGANSSSSSSSGGSRLSAAEADTDGKMAVMRMFARTFIETGIGLEQAINMVQAGDKDLLIQAFAYEAAAAGPTGGLAPSTGCAEAAAAPTVAVAAAPAANGGAGGCSTALDGLAVLGGEQISMPPAERGFSGPSGLQQLASRGAFTAAPATEGASGTASGLDNAQGGWGFSLFSNTACASSTSDAAAGNLFANLHL